MSIPLSATPQPIDDFDLWIAGFTQPTVLLELGALALCIAVACGLTWLLRRSLVMQDEKTSVLFGRHLVDGVMFPLLLLTLGYIARALLTQTVPLAVFKVAIPVLVSLVVIRVGVKVLQVAFATAPWVKVLERTISWLAWLAMVLWVSGLLPVVLNELDQIHWKIGASTISLRTMIEGALTAGAVLILSLWVSSAIERRLLRKADTLSRIGGDEFVIVLEEISNKESAIQVCQNIMKTFSQPVLVGNTPITVSLSIGVAIYDPESDDTLEDLMKKADIALYQVKDNDRNGFKLYGEKA